MLTTGLRAFLPKSSRSRRIALLALVALVLAVAGTVIVRPRPAYALVNETTLTVLVGKVEVWTTGATGYVAVPLGTRPGARQYPRRAAAGGRLRRALRRPVGRR